MKPREPLAAVQRATSAVVVAGRRVTDDEALKSFLALKLVAWKRGEWSPTAAGREALAAEP